MSPDSRDLLLRLAVTSGIVAWASLVLFTLCSGMERAERAAEQDIYKQAHKVYGRPNAAVERLGILFLGDSLTQYAFEPAHHGFAAGVAHWYQRKADVYNRGYAGYNSGMVLAMMQPIMESLPKIDLAIVCVGANDACLPTSGTNQRVEPNRFAENLRGIIKYLRRDEPTRPIILMTPPDVDESRLESRSSGETVRYARLVEEIGKELEIPVVNLFDPVEPKHLSDGLHFSTQGNELVLRLLKTCIEKEMEDLAPPERNEDLYEWRDLASVS